MQIYHVETQEDYDALMVELEKEGFTPFKSHIWKDYGVETVIKVNDTDIDYNDISEYEYELIPIQKYKAKNPGTRMQEGISRLARAMKQNDAVNSPNHYTQGELEVIDILQDKLTPQEFEGFLKGNILKYTFREGIKNGTEDMKKAAWYTARLIKFRGDNNDN